jgi:hypothetical protein
MLDNVLNNNFKLEIFVVVNVINYYNCYYCLNIDEHDLISIKGMFKRFPIEGKKFKISLFFILIKRI